MANVFIAGSTILSTWIDNLFKGMRKANIQSLLDASNAWKPSATNYSYRSEMDNRINYYLGAMQADMKEELERRFPQTHTEIEKEQVNLPLVRKKIKDMAKVFLNAGEFYLVDQKGNRIEGKQVDYFNELIKKSHIWSAWKLVDAYTQLCHRCLPKAWWDTKLERVRVSIWTPQNVHIVPNPKYEWDADRAYGVLLERPGVEGLIKTNMRYEVWGYREKDAAKVIQQDTVHFVTDGHGDYKMNKDDVNPFTDSRTGLPIYPFVWMQDDETTQLYTIGNEDMLTVNRTVNSGLTDMRQAVHYKAFGAWVHTKAEGGNDLGVKTISPSDVIDLEPGATLENIATNLPIEETFGYYEKLIQYDALLGGLVPSAMRIDSVAPESGYAQKLRNQPLIERRKDLIEIYYEPVVEFMRRIIIVNNTYNKKWTINEDYDVVWVPGEMESSVDPEQEGRIFAAEKEADVSTSVDWRMSRYNEDRTAAEESVRANAELNKELAAMGIVQPEQYSVIEDYAKTQEKPEELPETETKEPGTTEGIEEVESEKIVANVYQIVKAIEAGAATAVDLRMLLFPEEDRATATQMVKTNVPFNLEMARIQGEMQAAEEKALDEGTPDKELPPGLKKAAEEKAEEETEEEVE